MRFVLIVALSLLSRISSIAQDILTNEDIIKMSKSKVSNRLITDKIHTSRTNFDLTTSGLQTLIAANIAEPVLEEMLQVTKQSDVLTNEDVIKLHEARLSNRLLKQKIMASGANYSVNTDGLIQLKNARVPDAIVQLMMASTSKPTPQSQKAQAAPETKTELAKDSKRADYCKSWFDKFTKTNIIASKAVLRGRKAGNILLGRGASTLAGIEDLEVSLIFQREGTNLSLGLYASKPGLHELYVDKGKPFMLLLDDKTVMNFDPIQESESDVSLHLFSSAVDSNLLVYYSLTPDQLRILSQKLIKEYRLNTHNRHFMEDSVNIGRAQQVQAAARCLLDKQ
ncbi:hypothetical protein [Spirosoma sp. KNUC1025]|uniref:hypothetical protein n=1 Tax=Spirosoma sp. KNUC1025 TaxID=2894082 RepID=UPI00386778BF|nr:hypothetical protein LN737_12110 [Spirosoma sp. KNUC1025]